MFFVLLEFAENRANAGQWLAGHKAWIDQGLAEGVFLLVGSLKPNLGGAIVAHNTSQEALESRVQADPFVAQGVVTAKVLPFAPAHADPRLSFLIETAVS